MEWANEKSEVEKQMFVMRKFWWEMVDLDLKKQIFWLNQLKNKDNIPLLSTCSMVLNFEKKNY